MAATLDPLVPAAPRRLVPPPRATTKSERDRRSRERRVAKLHAMRTTLASLERALPIVLTLDDHHDVQWDGFLDADALRVRRLLCASLELIKEARRLQSTQYQLKALLREHYVASLVLKGVLSDRRADLNSWDAEGGRRMRPTVRPWTLAACQEEMHAALNDIRACQWSHDRLATGASSLGWATSVRIDTQRSAFTFQFEKTFRGYDVRDYVQVGWDAYTDPQVYQDVMVGHRSRTFEVLQQLAPDVVLVRGQRLPERDVDTHSVNLVFRVATERGLTQCTREVCCPELIEAPSGPQARETPNFIWFQWETLEDEDRAYTVRVGGRMRGTNVKYVQQWMLESLGCIIRGERLATGRKLIPSS